MNGIHDMGGMDGFGAVEPAPSEPVFHAEWERRVFALSLATGSLMPFTIDQFRYMREQIDPISYLERSYYEHWLIVLERQLLEAGLVSRDEIAARETELSREDA
jgi:nitrile hydratase